MSKTENKRNVIFDRYKSNLNLLIDEGVIKGNKDRYICPICLTPHTDLNSNDPLTLEDAPPKSLGGTANILTCKSCNNTAGYSIDFHLVERLREVDSANFLPGTETAVKVKIDDMVLNGRIIVEPDGKIQILHSKNNNHPEIFERKMKEITGGMQIDANFLKSRVIPEKLEYALLKTAYLLAFEKFGYSIMLHENYNIIREQLKNPDIRVYPENFWFSPPYTKEMSGVYFILDKGLESLIVLFNLDTGNSERMFGVVLPLPIHSIDIIIDKINNSFDKEGNLELELTPKNQDSMNYIDDIEEIRLLYNWIDKRKKPTAI